MKKLLTLPIALLACASLLVGCSKGESQKKSEQSSPVEPTSSEPSEVPPEPGDDEEEEIKFPETIDDAALIDFGSLSYDDKVLSEVFDAGAYSEDFIYENASLTRNIYSYMEYDFEYEEYKKNYYDLFVEFFEDGIYRAYDYTDNYFEYEGIGSLLYDYSHRTMTGVAKDDVPYYYAEIDQQDSTFNMWNFDDPSSNFATNVFSQIVDYIDYYGSFNYPAYKKIGNYHYFIEVETDRDTESFTDYAGNQRYTLKREISEKVFKFDEDFRLLGFYIYCEETADHNLYSGQLLPEPKIIYKSCDVYLLEYEENNVYPEKQALIDSIPEMQMNAAFFDYRIGSVLLGENGQLTAEPDFPSEYTKENHIYLYDDDHFGMSFYAYSDNAYAIDFDALVIDYTVLQGQDIGTETTFTIDMYSTFGQKIAEALGAEIKTFGGNSYFVVEGGKAVAFELVLPRYEEPNASNVEFIAVNPSEILLP